MPSPTEADIHLVSCVGVEFECTLLHHFLLYYRDLGIPIANFHIVLNAASDESPRLHEARARLASHGIVAEETWIASYTSDAMWQKRRDVQRRCVPPGHWVVSADVDEFHYYPVRLVKFLEYCEKHSVNCVDGPLVDRFSSDGRLQPVDPEQAPWNTFSIAGMIQGRLLDRRDENWLGTIKLMAYKAQILPARGGHDTVDYQPDVRFLYGRKLASFSLISKPAFRFVMPTQVHHFKWTQKLIESAEHRLATPGVSPAGERYARELLDFFVLNRGLLASDIPTQSARARQTSRIFWRHIRHTLHLYHQNRRLASRVRRKLPI